MGSGKMRLLEAEVDSTPLAVLLLGNGTGSVNHVG